jgi:hypothetical protein
MVGIGWLNIVLEEGGSERRGYPLKGTKFSLREWEYGFCFFDI